ncbi:MAG: hypothetical protein AB7I30_21565 [Isosphaeraceae bacterium]
MLTKMTVHTRRLRVPAVLVALVLGGQGCSDDGFGKRYTVTGTVTYNGEPLPIGRINFVPKDPEGRPAAGSIVNGKYYLTTHDPDDGALVGEYKVTITSYGGDLEKVQREADEAGGAQDAMPDQMAVAQAQKSLIPEKFGSFEGSGLTGDVRAKFNTIDFELRD